MKFNILPFGLLNQAVIAGLLLASVPVSANPVEVLQFIDQPPPPPPEQGDTFHKSDGEVLQLIDFDFSRPVRLADDEEYVDQDRPEDGEVYSDEDGDVLQYIGLGGGHEDVVYVNDDGQVEVEEFIDADVPKTASRSYPKATSPESLLGSSPSRDDFTPEKNSTENNFTRDLTPEVGSTPANNSTEKSFTPGFTPEKNSTELNLTRGFTPEVNSTLANNSTESSFTDGYSFGSNSTASPDDEEEGDGLLGGILDFFENLFRF